MEVTHLDILNKIPHQWVEVKNFISKLNNAPYFEELDNLLCIDEVDVLERQYLITVDTNKSTISFTDDLVDFERVYNYYGYDNINEWKESFNKLQCDMSEEGFNFVDTKNGGNDDYVWYKASINVKDFTEEKLLKITALWSKFNNDKRELVSNFK